MCDIFITLIPLGPMGVSLSLCPVESTRLGECINGGKFLVQLPPIDYSGDSLCSIVFTLNVPFLKDP